LTEIADELNKTPPVSLNFDYHSEMINLAAEDTPRVQRKQAIIQEIKQLREAKIAQITQQEKEAQQQKLAQVRKIITQAQEIIAKNGDTKEELEKAISDLKKLAVSGENMEKGVWIEKKTEHEKLLTDLEAKLAALPPSPPPTPPPGEGPEIPEETPEKK